MAASKTTRAKAEPKDDAPEAATEGQPQDNGRADYVPPDPPLDVQAEEVRSGKSYDGRLTGTMLRGLEPLLAYPLDPRYIQFTPKEQGGRPFDTTGVRSVQVQVDRMNEVLGAAHWRVLYRYEQGGQLCKAVVVVGNDLQYATLDDRGDLIPFLIAERTASGIDGVIGEAFKAEVLAVREGWGGHSRGSGPGDLFKGSETNALKRVLARLGPGAEVYRLDFDDDVAMSNLPEAKPVAARPAAQPAGPPPEQALEQLLNEDSPLAEKRREVAAGMVHLGAPPRQRLDELKAAADEKQLNALLDRVNIALDAGGQQPTLEVPADG